MNGLGSQKNRHLHIVEDFCTRARDGGIKEADAFQVVRGLAVLIKRPCGLEYLVNHKAVGAQKRIALGCGATEGPARSPADWRAAQVPKRQRPSAPEGFQSLCYFQCSKIYARTFVQNDLTGRRQV